MKGMETYSIFDIREADPQLEKHRKDVIEKYLEYGIVVLQNAKNEGKTLGDIIEQMKTSLWYVKNQRAEYIHSELGL